MTPPIAWLFVGLACGGGIAFLWGYTRGWEDGWDVGYTSMMRNHLDSQEAWLARLRTGSVDAGGKNV